MLAGLDLNLLTALHALLRHRSVSAAAAEVGRTQPALSHALARLRHHFNDPLLVRDGWSMRLTPFAETLRPQVETAAEAVARAFTTPAAFDPATTARQLTIATRDICAPLFTPLIADLATCAPGLRPRFEEAENIRSAVLQSEADLGLAFGPQAEDVSLTLTPLPAMPWASFAPADHLFARAPSLENWAAAQHIVVGSAAASTGPITRRLGQLGIARQILVAADSFAAALVLAAETGALFTTLRAPYAGLAARLGLTPLPLPFEMPPAPATLIRRASFGDPFHDWLTRRTAYLERTA